MPLDRDSRSSKMVAEYRRRGFLVLTAIWSRGSALEPNLEYAAVYSGAGGYGRRFGNLWVRAKWMCFLALLIWRNRKQIDVIHSVDLDVGIISVPLGRLVGVPVVYDAFDQMASFFRPSSLSRCLAAVERRTINWSTLAIFPDVARLKQYGVPASHKTIIVSNIPDFEELRNVLTDPANEYDESKKHLPLHFVYVGTLERTHRALEFIPSICDRFESEIIFSVAGVGYLDEFFIRELINRTNLRYLGQLAYHDAIDLMATADCLFGSYLLTTPAHKYAAPNKIYEHLALSKPLLTNTGTPVSDLVSKEHSGFLFDGSYRGLVELIEEITQDECLERGANAKTAWQKKYCRLRPQQLNDYFKALRSI